MAVPAADADSSADASIAPGVAIAMGVEVPSGGATFAAPGVAMAPTGVVVNAIEVPTDQAADTSIALGGAIDTAIERRFRLPSDVSVYVGGEALTTLLTTGPIHEKDQGGLLSIQPRTRTDRRSTQPAQHPARNAVAPPTMARQVGRVVGV